MARASAEQVGVYLTIGAVTNPETQSPASRAAKNTAKTVPELNDERGVGVAEAHEPGKSGRHWRNDNAVPVPVHGVGSPEHKYGDERHSGADGVQKPALSAPT